MGRVIIGDSQTIYLAGLARLLSVRDGDHIVARCSDIACLYKSLEACHEVIIIVASTLKPDFALLRGDTKNRVIVVAENCESCLGYISQGVNGVIYRRTSSAAFLDCVHRVAEGESVVSPLGEQPLRDQNDIVGRNVKPRLTAKELAILALIIKGKRNKHIAASLNTTEQVIKNYLRGVFDKTGVSDRLELALFTIHHGVLAAAAAKAGVEMGFFSSSLKRSAA